MTKFIVHAAKIPEAIQSRGRDERMQAGDMVYVNACDDRPWKDPKNVSPLDVDVCRACKLIVEVNRSVKKR